MESLDDSTAISLRIALDRAIDEFRDRDGELVQRACGAVNDGARLDYIVRCTFLGHVVAYLFSVCGRETTEALVATLLAELEAIRDQLTPAASEAALRN